MFGDQFWKHCIVIITHCDENNKIEDALQHTKNGIIDALNEASNNKFSNKLYTFGENNFEKSRLELLLNLHRNYALKYTLPDEKEKETPLNQLLFEMDKTKDKLKNLEKDIKVIKQQMKRVQEQFDQVKRNVVCNDDKKDTYVTKKVM